MRVFVGSLILLILVILILGRSENEPLSAPTPTAESRQCSEELIQLAELVLQDPKQFRELYHDKLQELDPSDDMAIAVELLDNDLLKRIVEETRDACSKSGK